MKRQNSVAQQLDYTFLATARDVRQFVDKGILIALRGNSHYKVADVSYPYARPAIKTFVERLAPQYKSACGEKLVVTSLTRPISRQPWNAHELSVHPAGMALDLRYSGRSSCRRWLEGTLQGLESKGVLEATKERRPAHYHIAVFPAAYERYVNNLSGSSFRVAGSSSIKVAGKNAPLPLRKTTPMRIAQQTGATSYATMLPMGASSSAKSSVPASYKVRRGDSLWSIAREQNVTIAELKKANGLKRSTIAPGQTLQLPGNARMDHRGAGSTAAR